MSSIIINTISNDFYYDYDSDYSDHTDNSDNSDNSSISNNSTNSTNSDNSTNSTNSANSTNSTNSLTSNYYNKKNNYSINYYKRKSPKTKQKHKQMQTQTQTHRLQTWQSSVNNEEINENTCELCNDEIGYISDLTKETPFIKYLIDKRINFCQLGASSHIAAFVPVSFNSRCCFIHNGKWKGRYR